MKHTTFFIALLLLAQLSYAGKKERSGASRQPSKPPSQPGHAYVITTTTYTNSGTALTNVHKGYVVYNKDTSTGYLHMSHDTLFMSAAEAPSVNMKVFTTADTLLQTFMIYNPDNNGNLRITRVKEYGNSFYRVLHSGKINLYDNVYTFPSTINIEIPKMKIVIEGSACESFFSLDPKKHLIKLINKTYGLKLNTQLSNDEVLGHITNLDS